MTLSILVYCRPGFESEAAWELQEKAQNLQIQGYIKATKNSAYALYCPENEQQAYELWFDIGNKNLIFARQVLLCFDFLKDLPQQNRVQPIVEAAKILRDNYSQHTVFNQLFVEVPDTNEQKELLVFCKKLSTPLQIALEKNEILKNLKKNKGTEQEERSKNDLLHNLHLLFLDNQSCYLAVGTSEKSSPHFMGIPRLKFPAKAPSRSTLKLEEAFLFFLTEKQRKLYLKPGMFAVDLGASPGGWTYQFVSRGVSVFSVDNANMDKQLMETGLMHHVRQDGFKYTPTKQVHWMVCDMVERPSRITQLVSHWAQMRFAKYFIFNLKLPMKKRAQEVYTCLENLVNELEQKGISLTIQAKQLYHDREEITVWLQIH